MMRHLLKCWPGPFQAIWDGDKTFELRRDDRDFHKGDFLLIQEFVPHEQTYTGREITAYVPYVAKNMGQWGLCQGHCIMSIDVRSRSESPSLR